MLSCSFTAIHWLDWAHASFGDSSAPVLTLARHVQDLKILIAPTRTACKRLLSIILLDATLTYVKP